MEGRGWVNKAQAGMAVVQDHLPQQVLVCQWADGPQVMQLQQGSVHVAQIHLIDLQA